MSFRRERQVESDPSTWRKEGRYAVGAEIRPEQVGVSGEVVLSHGVRTFEHLQFGSKRDVLDCTTPRGMRTLREDDQRKGVVVNVSTVRIAWAVENVEDIALDFVVHRVGRESSYR